MQDVYYNYDCTVEDYVPQTKSELFDLEFKDYKRCFNRDMNMFKECIDGLREELRGVEKKVNIVFKKTYLVKK